MPSAQHPNTNITIVSGSAIQMPARYPSSTVSVLSGSTSGWPQDRQFQFQYQQQQQDARSGAYAMNKWLTETPKEEFWNLVARGLAGVHAWHKMDIRSKV